MFSLHLWKVFSEVAAAVASENTALPSSSEDNVYIDDRRKSLQLIKLLIKLYFQKCPSFTDPIICLSIFLSKTRSDNSVILDIVQFSAS